MSMFAVKSKGKTPEEAFEGALGDAQVIGGEIVQKNSFVKLEPPLTNEDPEEYAYGLMMTGGTKVTPDGPAGCFLLKDNMGRKPANLSRVDNYTKSGTKKWRTVYAIYRYGGPHVTDRDYKQEAIDYARELAERNGRKYKIHIEKRLTSHGTLEAVVKPKYDGEPKDYRNEYLFFGWNKD